MGPPVTMTLTGVRAWSRISIASMKKKSSYRVLFIVYTLNVSPMDNAFVDTAAQRVWKLRR
jgi:hypothetical protein